ncbi:MAG: hypothetical protein RL562_3253 [Planctomycetota bacterium]
MTHTVLRVADEARERIQAGATALADAVRPTQRIVRPRSGSSDRPLGPDGWSRRAPSAVRTSA